MVFRKRDLIVLGECFVELGLGDHQRIDCQGLGGDNLAVAAAASRLNSKVDWIGVIGLDPFGEYIRAECLKENIDMSHTMMVDGYNAVYGTYVNDRDGREFAFHRSGSAAQRISAAQVHEDHIRNAKIVHSSSMTQSLSPAARKAVFKAFEVCHFHDGMVSYDPNLRLRQWSLDDAKEAMWSVMPFLDVIFPSAPDESKALFGYERPIDVIGFLWDHGVNVVVVKTGEKGCMVGYDGKVQEIQAEPVSGDKHYACVGSAFCGGFLHGIAAGLDPFKSARIASRVASFKLARQGSVRGLPKAEEIPGLMDV